MNIEDHQDFSRFIFLRNKGKQLYYVKWHRRGHVGLVPMGTEGISLVIPEEKLKKDYTLVGTPAQENQ